MKRKQTVVLPANLDAKIFHAFVIKNEQEWARHKVAYREVTDEMEAFMKENNEACISTFGYPVTHGQFYAYLTVYMKQKITKKDFLASQRLDELTMRWLEAPTTLAPLINHYGVEPPTKAAKKDLRDGGMYSNGYANALAELNSKLHKKIKRYLGDGVSIEHMIAFDEEKQKAFFANAVQPQDDLNDVILDAKELYDGVVDALKSYRGANRALVEAMEYHQYSDDEESEESERGEGDDEEDEDDE